jgi:hypothetical protein
MEEETELSLKSTEKAKKAEEIRQLKSQLRKLEELETSGEVTQSRPSLTPEQKELAELRREVLKLQKIISKSELPSAAPTSKEWTGEMDFNHPGIETFAKAMHKKYKEVDLSSDFVYTTPFTKGNNDLSEAKLLWTNCTTLLKILSVKEWDDHDMSLMGVTLNMCLILAQKRDLAVVRANTDEETAKLFKSMRNSSNLMAGRNKDFMEQAISLREAQVRIGVNVPRQREFNSNNNNYNNYNNHNNSSSRGGYRGRGSYNNSRGRGQQYHQAIQQYSSPAPNSGAGTKE